MNLNEMAQNIAYREGGAVNLSIAQIKEVMRIFLEELAHYPDDEIIMTIAKYGTFKSF